MYNHYLKLSDTPCTSSRVLHGEHEEMAEMANKKLIKRWFQSFGSCKIFERAEKLP